MDWNVKNAVNRDVERQHLNKILKEIRGAVDELEASVAAEDGLEDDVRQVVAGLVENNTEHGITVIYNSDGEVLDFIVNDFTIRLSGDVTGEADVVGLRDVNITATIDPALIGIPEAPIDGYPHWRYGGEWQQVTGGLEQLEELIENGFTVKVYDGGSGEHTWIMRQMTVVAGELTVDDADGVSGNPLFGLADVTPVVGGTFLLTEFDSKGRRIEEQAGTAADVPYDNTASGLTADDVQEAIDELAAMPSSGGILPVVTGEIVSGQPVFVYFDDGSLLYSEVA